MHPHLFIRDVFGRVMEPLASTPIHARHSLLCVGSYARNCRLFASDALVQALAL
jgi:hypothetical protein